MKINEKGRNEFLSNSKNNGFQKFVSIQPREVNSRLPKAINAEEYYF